MIVITMFNSETVVWKPCEYNEYLYDGKYFIIIKDGKWVGFYNLVKVIAITVQEVKTNG